MTHAEALTVCRMLAEVYRRDEWTPERYEVWAALLADLPLDAVVEAVRGWARAEKWPPSPAELRALVFENLQATAEHARLERIGESRLALAAGPAQPLSTAQLHLWRAAMGSPVPGCGCDSCSKGRAVAPRPPSRAAVDGHAPKPAEVQAEVERVREWANETTAVETKGEA